MKIDRIKYSQEGNDFGNHFWIGAEAEIDSDKEDFQACMDKLRHLVSMAGAGTRSGGNGVSHVVETQVGKTPKEAAIDSQIVAIQGCTSLKSIEMFRKLVERENNDRLTAAFEIKLQSLQNK